MFIPSCFWLAFLFCELLGMVDNEFHIECIPKKWFQINVVHVYGLGVTLHISV
jgi:hypothetical protein